MCPRRAPCQAGLTLSSRESALLTGSVSTASGNRSTRSLQRQSIVGRRDVVLAQVDEREQLEPRATSEQSAAAALRALGVEARNAEGTSTSPLRPVEILSKSLLTQTSIEGVARW